ncbi:MAG TPA: FimV/HubP family polar landmark protein [Burkholderiales bacterium]|nr:FimV/HubP family polar landmark protein [Burkholderiales bacterium]
MTVGFVRNLGPTGVLLAALLLMPGIASAAGLGKLTVLSALGQPFHAEIDLISVDKDELGTLSARLAPPDAYKQANLQYSPLLVGLRLNIEKRAGGQPYIKITSSRPANDPFADLLIELNWSSGRIMREYMALIDPPGYGLSSLASMPAVPESYPVPAQRPPAAATLAPKKPLAAAKASAATRKYGPVKRGETLGKIARRLKPADVTLEQMLSGLYRDNPDAFVNGNMNLLKVGETLQVPDRQKLLAIPRQDALKEYRVQVANWKAYRRNLADAARPASENRKGKAAARPDAVHVTDQANSGKDGKPVLRLSAGVPPGGKAAGGTSERVRLLEEELVAQGKALNDANERIRRLEKALQNSTVAAERSQ